MNEANENQEKQRSLLRINRIKWARYSFEFMSIFVAVVSAFALNNWNDQRKNELAASKILLEIFNGTKKDVHDIASNIYGHEQGLAACDFWRDLILGKEVDLDSLGFLYIRFTRDFISIQNSSGYETLKSKGFELITNDSLRSNIITLYEFEYQALRKLEEEYHEGQFQKNYFQDFNRIMAPHFVFDDKGSIVGIDLPLRITDSERKILLSYILKININRKFMLALYAGVEDKILQLQNQIELELQK